MGFRVGMGNFVEFEARAFRHPLSVGVRIHGFVDAHMTGSIVFSASSARDFVPNHNLRHFYAESANISDSCGLL